MDNNINVKLLSIAGQGGSIFGISLMNMMKERDDLMVLSSDMSTPAGLDKFKATYPDHFMNVGIAEQNMIGIAAGLTNEGFRTVCVAQACFITMRSFEQVRQYCGYMKTPLILVGIGSGLSLQYMGNTHYAIEDIALMRTIPGMTVIAPCDSLEAIKAFEFAIHHDGPIYIRLFGGTSVPSVYNEDYNFVAGKSVSLREGNDIDIIATGSMVSVAIKGADALLEDRVSASVINMHTIKPIDVSTINSDKKLIVTLEEHSIIGGLGDAVNSFSDHKHKVLKIGINDRYVPVGSYPYMLEQCGLTVEQIKNQIINKLK